MSPKKKNKVRTIDGKAIYLQPGIYGLIVTVPSSLLPTGEWRVGSRFVIERHVDKIGDQNAYEYYSARVAGNHKHLIRSYQHTNWNTLVTKLSPVEDNLGALINDGGIPPLYVLDELEQSGVISREDIEKAIEDINLKVIR